MVEQDAKFYYNKGIIYNEEGKYGLAVDNFKTALSFDKDSVEIIFNLGLAYLNKKEYVSSIECFRNVISKTPDETAAYSNLALAYMKNHEYALSIENYKKVLELDPDDKPTYKDLGDAYTKNKQYDEAIECYNNFLQAFPTSFVVKESLSTAINLKKNSEKNKNSNEIIEKEDSQLNSEIEDKTPEDYFNEAINFVKEQHFDLAIEHLRKCLKKDPENKKASELINKIFNLKGKTGNPVQKTVTEAKIPVNPPVKEIKPQMPFFIDYRKFNEYFTLGLAYYNAKNYDLALENFKKGLEINPEDKTCVSYIKEITAN